MSPEGGRKMGFRPELFLERERKKEKGKGRERERYGWIFGGESESGSVLKKPHMGFAMVYHTHTLTLVYLSFNPNGPSP